MLTPRKQRQDGDLTKNEGQGRDVCVPTTRSFSLYDGD